MSAAGSSLTSSYSQVLDWIFPKKCALCGLAGLDSPCPTCQEAMRLAAPDYVAGEDVLTFRACRYAYEGRAAQAVRCLKYSRSTSLVDFMAETVRARLDELGITTELVIPVPMNPGRWSWRGFNHSELLLEKCPYLDVRRDALKRIRNTKPQVGLTLKERQDNLRGAFRASNEVKGRDIVLVDDVVTSGQTGLECARELLDKGAKSVGIVSFAGNLI